jgi:hypothetical protein
MCWKSWSGPVSSFPLHLNYSCQWAVSNSDYKALSPILNAVYHIHAQSPEATIRLCSLNMLRLSWTIQRIVGFEVLSAVAMKSNIFWDITSCSQLKVSWRFGGAYRLNLQDRIFACFHADIFPDSFFDPEVGGEMSLWNVGWLSTDYTALYPTQLA